MGHVLLLLDLRFVRRAARLRSRLQLGFANRSTQNGRGGLVDGRPRWSIVRGWRRRNDVGRGKRGLELERW
jgi:hypothetical protein